MQDERIGTWTDFDMSNILITLGILVLIEVFRAKTRQFLNKIHSSVYKGKG